MMDEPEKTDESWREYISPLKLTILAISWICFCACLVLLASGRGGLLLVLFVIGTGLYFAVELICVIVAVRKRHSAN